MVASSEHFTDNTLDRSTLGEIQKGIIKKGTRNPVSRFFHAKNDKDTIAGWKSDLTKILLVFNVSSVVVYGRCVDIANYVLPDRACTQYPHHRFRGRPQCYDNPRHRFQH